MRFSLIQIVLSCALIVGISSSALAATKTNSTSHKKVDTRGQIKSGLLFSIGKTGNNSSDVTESLTALGFPGANGGDTDTKVSLAIGYRHAFNKRISLDIQYVDQDTSTKPLSITVPEGTEAAAAEEISKKLPKLAQGVSVVGLYHAPITPKLRSHLGGGAFIWKGERETKIGSASAIDKDNGTNFMLQVGLGYQINAKFSVEGNFQRVFLPDEAMNRVSLGLVYSF